MRFAELCELVLDIIFSVKFVKVVNHHRLWFWLARAGLLTPKFKFWFCENFSHDLDHIFLRNPKFLFNNFKRFSLFLSHADKSFKLFIVKRYPITLSHRQKN